MFLLTNSYANLLPYVWRAFIVHEKNVPKCSKLRQARYFRRIFIEATLKATLKAHYTVAPFVCYLQLHIFLLLINASK